MPQMTLATNVSKEDVHNEIDYIPWMFFSVEQFMKIVIILFMHLGNLETN